jgi:hypothetical protein
MYSGDLGSLEGLNIGKFLSRAMPWKGGRKAMKKLTRFVTPLFQAPGRILIRTVKGDFRGAAGVIANPLARTEATRQRYLRRAGGAVSGAVGGFLTGGFVGAAVGGGIGLAKAGKGHGQLKDYGTSFGIGLATGGIVRIAPTIYSKGASLLQTGGTAAPLNPSVMGSVATKTSLIGKVGGAIVKTVKVGTTLLGVKSAISPGMPVGGEEYMEEDPWYQGLTDLTGQAVQYYTSQAQPETGEGSYLPNAMDYGYLPEGYLDPAASYGGGYAGGVSPIYEGPQGQEMMLPVKASMFTKKNIIIFSGIGLVAYVMYK